MKGRFRTRTSGTSSITSAALGLRSSVVALAACGLAAGAVLARAQTAPSPTFNKDIAPILYAQCVSCHRPNEIAPMSLVTYDDARPWARSIKAKVTAGE